jgi:hypothetical protein
MSIPIKVVLTLGLILIPSFVFARLITIPTINRKIFSLLSSLLIGFQLFILVIMYVRFQTIVIGLILFVFAIPGTFPAAYFLYPGLKTRIETRMKKHL